MFTAKDGVDIKGIINDVIEAGIKFEELMEKIDFNSWFEKIDKDEKIKKIDTKENLKSNDDKKAFEHYQKTVNKAVKICERFINSRYEKEISYETVDKKQFVKSLIHCLFKAKLKRLEAQRTSTPSVGINKYIESGNILNRSLNSIPPEYFYKSPGNERKKDYNLLKILLYNDLSICYAGFKNSSMSRGFAEESIKLIENDEDYLIFKRKIENLENKIIDDTVKKQDYDDVTKTLFLSGKNKKYDLYTFALFCKGVAEYRSSLFTEAEKTFKKIINYVDRYKCNRNSDYFSTSIYLANLLIDLSCGKEAIEIIQKIEDNQIINKLDRRWAESILEKASALTDRSDYKEARQTLDKLYNFKNFEGESEDKKRYAKIILNGFINYGRSYLEEAKNMLPTKELNRRQKNRLKKAKKYLKEAYNRSKRREQKSLIRKSTKYLAESAEIEQKPKDSLKYYSISISEDEVENFENLLKDWKQKDFVNRCEDIDILDDFSRLISKDVIDKFYKKQKCDKKLDNEISFCLQLLITLKKECDEKEYLIRSERAEQRKIELESIQTEREMECTIPKTAGKKSYEKNYKILIGKAEGRDQKEAPLGQEEMKERLDRNENKFDESLYGRTKPIENSLAELIVLRRWNSFSPGLSRRHSLSLGGGYLLRIFAPEFNKNIQGEDLFNIVIDPGYNFLHNFHSENFKIEDIDAVVVTHSHPDHCAELPAIMDLMRQINKRRRRQNEKKKRKRIYLLLSKGAHKKFSPYIQDWKKQLRDVVLLENKTTWPEKEREKEFQITTLQTAHADLGGVRAIGILVLINGKKDIKLGFTGDTPWRESVKNNFKKCDILCIHIGGIKDEEIGYEENGTKINENELCQRIQRRLKEANHLLFYGSKDIINDCKKQDSIVIVGEFGEELKYRLRTDIVKKLNPPGDVDPFCIPADSGLYLIITEEENIQHKKIRCGFCREFIDPRKIEIFAYGMIDSLHYICKACNSTLTESQKRTVVEYQLTRH